MLLALPDHETLYRALVGRDPSYEDLAYVTVSTTGVFCPRLASPQTKPRKL